ncbi:MAG: rhombosortase [Deltaproteobacteria bacterium]|nr:rhombosortase [Deltaproteobacteria bacterium]
MATTNSASPGPPRAAPAGTESASSLPFGPFSFGSFLFFGALAFLALAFSLPALLFGRRAVLGLIYQRGGIGSGEVWRLLTGHGVHLEVTHLVWNLVALGVVALLFGSRFSSLQWTGIALVTAMGCGLGLWFLSPQVIAMVGLSGLLHGLLAAGALGTAAAGRATGWFALALLVAKLALEQGGLSLPGAAVSSAEIAVEAHLYGAISGFLVGGALVFRPPGSPSPQEVESQSG